jgi:diguanylate cyclase (GGDEF)-like protein
VLLKSISDISYQINEIGKIRGGVQRYVKICLLRQDGETVYKEIKNRIKLAINFEKQYDYFFYKKDVKDIIELDTLVDRIRTGFQTGRLDEKSLYNLSENAWRLSNEIVSGIADEAQYLIKIYVFVSYGLLPFMLLLYLTIKVVKYKIQDNIEYRANVDNLTGLYNRYSLEDLFKKISLEMNPSGVICLLLCDIDHFKMVNDRYGHDVGDNVLCDVAKNIKKTCRDKDYVFRYGGEEFVVLTSIDNFENVRVFGERIRSSVENAAIIEGQKVTISIGIAVGVKNNTLDALLKQADEALYAAKNSGRNRVVIKDVCKNHSIKVG